MFKGVKAWAPLAISMIALFAALGGVGWAAGLISGNTIKPNSIPLNRLTKATSASMRPVRPTASRRSSST